MYLKIPYVFGLAFTFHDARIYLFGLQAGFRLSWFLYAMFFFAFYYIWSTRSSIHLKYTKLFRLLFFGVGLLHAYFMGVNVVRIQSAGILIILILLTTVILGFQFLYLLFQIPFGESDSIESMDSFGSSGVHWVSTYSYASGDKAVDMIINIFMIHFAIGQIINIVSWFAGTAFAASIPWLIISS